ncbi:MAG: DUF1559 domain-containing protein [Candidatus Eisenbacteria bacterium]|nr:DUF1559 domain-containing protein [Candidatus Eisenbacteria bacterium]
MPEAKTGPKVSWIRVGVIVLLALAAWVVLSAPFPGSGRERARRTKCASNLKQIGYACHLYSGDHEEAFPPSLGAVFPEYIPDGRVFICPLSGGYTKVIAVADLPEGAEDASAVFGPEHTDYEYVAGLRATDPPTLVLAYDRDGNHEDGNHGDGRNVLFVGNNVVWTPEDDFRKALQRTREHLAARGR